MNRVELMGRMVRDPEITDRGGMDRMAKFSLAVRRPRQSQDGTSVDFIPCVAFGRPALNAEKYLKQGMIVGVTGKIRTGNYTNKEGRKVYTTDVLIDEVEFAESKADMERRLKEERAAERAAKKEAKDTPAEPVETPREAPTPSEPTPVNNRPVPMEDEFMSIPEDFGDEMPFS